MQITGLRKLCDSARAMLDMYGNLVMLIEREIGLQINWQPKRSTSLYRDDVALGCTQNYFIIKFISCSMFKKTKTKNPINYFIPK